VPLSSASPTSFDTALPSDGSDMLPLSHLTPKTLLGAGGEQRETVGQLCASQMPLLHGIPKRPERCWLDLGYRRLTWKGRHFLISSSWSKKLFDGTLERIRTNSHIIPNPYSPRDRRSWQRSKFGAAACKSHVGCLCTVSHEKYPREMEVKSMLKP
jgi:hypothetical protein